VAEGRAGDESLTQNSLAWMGAAFGIALTIAAIVLRSQFA
jgi:hypothetical protein